MNSFGAIKMPSRSTNEVVRIADHEGLSFTAGANLPLPVQGVEHEARCVARAGVDATFSPVKGAGHGGREFSSEENRKLLEKFFDKHLKKGS
jgi:hypothetical protein